MRCEILEKVGKMGELAECEKVVVSLQSDPQAVWSASNIPVMLRGIVQFATKGGAEVSKVVSTYSNSTESLKTICEENGFPLPLLMRMSDTYPAIAQELELAERTRARIMESKAAEPYNCSPEESLAMIQEETITRDGDTVLKYSSAAATHLKSRASILLKQASYADKKRYGDSSEGQTINIGVQTNVSSGPDTLEELQSMSISEMMDTQRPGTN